MSQPPAEVSALARRRSAARHRRDFATADALRAEIIVAGWTVEDTPEGFTLTRKPPFDTARSVADLPDRADQADTRRATISVIVDGWPDDVAEFIAAVLRHVPDDVKVLALDIGDRDGAGTVLHELALMNSGRIIDLHVEGPTTWAAAVTALARADTAAVHVLTDLSTIFTGDAVTPLLAEFDEPTVVGAGWRGVRARSDWRSFEPAPAGDVEALLGYCFAIRRAALLQVPPDPKARFYRNADLELSYAIRAAGLGRLVVPAAELQLRQGRHHGYEDSDPAYRDAESKSNYERFLRRFRGRDDLRLTPGS